MNSSPQTMSVSSPRHTSTELPGFDSQFVWQALSKLIRCVTCLALLLSGMSTASGALLSLNDATHGPDSITRDTATGLEWLDLTLSTNRSYNDVSSQLGVGGDYAGFRYATAAELTTLFYTSAGITPGYQSPREIEVEQLQDLLGRTLVQNFGHSIERSSGVFDCNCTNGFRVSVIRTERGTGGNNFSRADVGNGGFGLDEAYTSVGSFLVRSVPEPSSLVLLLSWTLFGYRPCRTPGDFTMHRRQC